MFFGDDAVDAARIQAIDELHFATAIYTAQPLVDELLDRLEWPRRGATFADPSCGDGMFLGRALTRALSSRLYSDDELPHALQGWEIHPHACMQARARVEAILIAFGRPSGVAASLAEAMIHNRDFLTEGPTEPQFTTIASNPPYLRFVNVPRLLKEEYMLHVPGYAAKDLLHSFLDRCARTLQPGGQLAMVTADRWLFNENAADLRRTLGESSLRIEHLSRHDVNTAFYRPKQRKTGTLPRVHPVSVVLSRMGTIPLTGEAVYPGVDSARYAGMRTLDQIATVSLAPELGPPGIFLLTEAQRQAADIAIEHVVPAVDTDDLVGNTIGTPTRFALRTFRKVTPPASILKHLDACLDGLSPGARRNVKWVPPESFEAYDLDSPALMVPRVAQSPRAFRLPPGVLPFKHNLSVRPKPGVTLEEVERALNSEIAAQWIRDHAAPLENGYYSLRATLLRQLPFQE